MNYSLIRNMDISNGPGIRVSLFCSGCEFHCKGCFNPDTWNFNHGKEFTEETMNTIIELLKPSYIGGFSILGGEPLNPRNVEQISMIASKVRSEYPDKSIWLWSGYRFEDLNELQKKCLEYVDVMVDGQFVEELKDFKLKYSGSSNQRVIDVPKTLAEGKVVELKF